ncbi:MAG: DOMON domain-containing protein [Candidatus Bipolaricaulis sp.]|nr:DOMON domain-containing protein [Candidatus Bipolaricaulis sp.]
MSKWVLIALGVALAAGFATWLVLTQWPAVEPVAPASAPAVAATPPAEVPTTGNAQAAAAPTSPEPKPAAPVRVTLSSVDGVISDGEYPHSVEIAGVKVYWVNDGRVLCIGLVSPGTGYVAIGLDPVERMLGANFVLGSVAEGVLTIRDDYGNAATGHDADTTLGGTDNLLSAAGHQWADQTVVEFVIPLNSGDSTDKQLVPGSSYPILVAYNALSDDFSARHSRRGTGRITLDPAP